MFLWANVYRQSVCVRERERAAAVEGKVRE